MLGFHNRGGPRATRKGPGNHQGEREETLDQAFREEMAGSDSRGKRGLSNELSIWK